MQRTRSASCTVVPKSPAATCLTAAARSYASLSTASDAERFLIPIPMNVLPPPSAFPVVLGPHTIETRSTQHSPDLRVGAAGSAGGDAGRAEEHARRSRLY